MDDIRFFKYDPVVDGDKTFNIDQALNDNWDQIAERDKEVRTALSTKADDDFTHIPMVVCETAGDQKVKQITIPDYDENRYPIIAIRFANTNTSDGVNICINGNNNGTGYPLYLGQGGSVSVVNNKLFPIRKGNVILIQKPNTYDAYTIVGTSASANTARYGPTILAHNPRIEHPDPATCAATPSYVEESLKAFNDFTHIPLVVCDTPGDQPIKEVTIPNYTPEKYPIFAVCFTYENDAGSYVRIKINGGDVLTLFSANDTRVTYTKCKLAANDIYLMQLKSTGVKLIGTYSTATSATAGILKIADTLDEISPGKALDATMGRYLYNSLHDLELRSLCAWGQYRTYPINTLVMQDGAIYKSLQDNNLNHPITDPAWWAEYGGNDPEIEQIINYTMLYDSGDECGEVTGGWSKTYSRGLAGATETITKAHNRISMQCNGSGSVGAIVAAGPDTALAPGYKQLIAHVDASATSSASGGIRDIILCCGAKGARPDETIKKVKKNTNGAFIECMSLDVQGESGYPQIAQVVAKDSDSVLRIRTATLLKSDDPSRLLRTAGITTTYATPEALAADTSARSKILSSSKAVNALVKTCTGDLMYAILNNADWITAIKGNDAAYRIIMANPHWSKFVGIIPAAKELLNYTMLYDQGDECESVTGGWNADYAQTDSSGTINYVMSKLTFKSDRMNGSLPSGSAMRACYRRTTNEVDVQKYNHVGGVVNVLSRSGSSILSTAASIRVGNGNTLPTPTSIATDVGINILNGEITDSAPKRVMAILQISTGQSGYSVAADFHNIFLLRTDPYTPWLTAANITKSFANLEAVFADTTTLSILMSNRDAINYMISCTGTLMAGICNNEAAMTALVNSPVAYDAAFENAHWFKFMTMCPVSLAAMDSVAKTVPVMTSNTAPEGEAFAKSIKAAGTEAYRAFDKVLNIGSRFISNECPSWIQYDFTSPVMIYKFEITTNGTNTVGSPTKFRLCSVDDGTVAPLCEYTETYATSALVTKVYMVPCPTSTKSVRLDVLSSINNAEVGIIELQFYGKEVI